MAKFYLTLCSALTILLIGGCSSIESISIDYMSPASLTFPNELKKVAIVNNTSAEPDNKLIITANEKEVAPNERYAVSYANGNPAITAQSLADEIANQQYFDVVVICDSALRSNDRFPRETTLSQEEVQQLTAELGVDFIIAVENMQIKASKTVIPLPEYNNYLGATDAKVYPTVSIYLPMRTKPMTTLHPTDSIYWENYGGTVAEALTRMIPDEQLIRESSDFAGTVPVKYLLPIWEKDTRYLYTGGSPQMRDAAIFAKENSWDKAYNLWRESYDKTKSEKKRLETALNIAVYYEITDSLLQAKEWAQKAQQHAEKAGYKFVDKGTNEYSYKNRTYLFITKYIDLLQNRAELMSKLKLQMSRFNNDF